MTFDEILATVDGKGFARFPEGWGQGRALFGGLVGAVLFDHLQKTVATGRFLRSFSLSFVAPASPGEVALEATVLREGKSVMQAMVSARQAFLIPDRGLPALDAGLPGKLLSLVHLLILGRL